MKQFIFCVPLFLVVNTYAMESNKLVLALRYAVCFNANSSQDGPQHHTYFDFQDIIKINRTITYGQLVKKICAEQLGISENNFARILFNKYYSVEGENCYVSVPYNWCDENSCENETLDKPFQEEDEDHINKMFNSTLMHLETILYCKDFSYFKRLVMALHSHKTRSYGRIKA